MKKASSSHAGEPHSSTLRKPGLVTAKPNTTDRNIQIMGVDANSPYTLYDYWTKVKM